MKKIIMGAALAVSLLTVMTACSGGGGSDAAVGTTINEDGLWFGTQTIQGVDYDLAAIVYNGNTYGYSVQAQSMFAGAYTMNGTTLTANGYTNYNPDGSISTTGNLTTTVTENQSLNGSFSNNLNQAGTISLVFSNQYNLNSSLDYLASRVTGNGIDFTIAADGTIAGITNGCGISGNATVPDSNVNIYEINYVLSTCAEAGTYTGFGAITYTNGVYLFEAGMTSNTRMDLFIAYIDKPASW